MASPIKITNITKYYGYSKTPAVLAGVIIVAAVVATVVMLGEI